MSDRTPARFRRWLLAPMLALLAAFAVSCGPGLSGSAPVGLAFGGVLHGYNANWEDRPSASVANDEFNAVTATAYMAYIGWQGPADPINTTGLTEVMEWANQRDKRVHGHVLVYPAANRDLGWFQNENINHEAVLRNYVDTISAAAESQGGMWVWDVVNEVMADPGDSRVDAWGLRNDYIEHQEIPNYVDKAFRWADAANPNAELIINDYGAEEINEKSNNLFAYVQELQRRGVPIDGVGSQMHINGADGPPDYQSIRDNFTRFANAGFDIYITEMDVTAIKTLDPNRAPTAGQLAAQSDIYQEIALIARSQPRVKSLLLWDFLDGDSWLNPTDRPLGGIPQGSYTYPAPWSGGDWRLANDPASAKPAVEGLRKGLAGVPVPPPPAPTGWARLNNDWLPGSGSLTRSSGPAGPDGVAPPSDEVILHSLAGEAAGWTSNQWRFIDAGGGWWRIQSRWGAASGFLTRLGEPIPGSDEFRATDQVHLLPRSNFTGQQWRIVPASRGRIQLVNRWESDSGYLTRLGRPNPNGDGSIATNLVHLTGDGGFTSQLWRRVPVG